MSSKAHVLSGEEALNDYFTDLLDEEWEAETEDAGEELKVTSELLVQEGQHSLETPNIIENQNSQVTQESVDSEEKPEAEITIADTEIEPVEAIQPLVTEDAVLKTDVLVSEPEKYDSGLKNVKETTPELQTKVHPDYHTSYTELEYNEFEAPDLKDIQKLLDKLEALNGVPETDIVTILEKNTAEIHQTETVVDEIQEWDVDILEAEPVAEVVVAEPEITKTHVVVEPEVFVEEAVKAEQVVETEQDIEVETQVELETQAGAILSQEWESTQRSEDFQVLYFEVNSVTFAVPLDELGGIHRIGDMNHLIGRPDWYLGLQTNKDDQLDVVDTAKWVMAERLVDDSHKDAYQYVVMLGESKWGLAGTQLQGTELLNTDKVRWREKSGKRPWLAGMVKEKMCALIHVDAMIAMLDAGLDVKALDN